MKKLLLSALLSCAAVWAFATHNRAGEITYRWLSGYNYEITVTTYTKQSSPADRCELVVYFGDGDSATFYRSNGGCGVRCDCPVRDGVDTTNDIRINKYTGTHTYPGPGTYDIYMMDPNRNAGIVNIPNSVNVPFYIRSRLIINPFLFNNNSSPVLTYPPIDNGCLYKLFIHNPGAYDPDGDSLSYELTLCLGAGGVPVQQFNNNLPYNYQPNISVNPMTGDLIWNTPQPGPNPPFNSYPQEHNFAMLIKEWRKAPDGQWYLIGYVMRDLQVDIDNCPNNPPAITNVQDTCVMAGNTLNFQVTATDPDNDLITLSATGGIFNSVNPPATFTAPGTPSVPPVTGTFNWNTNCNLVRNQPYLAVFKAADNDPQNPLVDLQSVLIYVHAPPVSIDSAVPECNSIRLYWGTAPCNPNSNFVTGYKIYRKSSCDSLVPSPCETDVPASWGYTLVGVNNGYYNTVFTDNNLVYGVNYSYRVVATYSDGAVSYASPPFCTRLLMDVPIMRNVDVVSTGNSDTIRVKWIRPLAGANNLDTLAHPGPYVYKVYRGAGLTTPNFSAPVATFTAPTYSALTIDSFIDTGLGTDASAFVYSVQLFAQNGSDTLCRASNASSVYLSLTPGDNQLTLSWQYNVPWTNYLFHIYKETPTGSGNWVLLDSTAQTTYVDNGLVNGATYCYKIKAYGQYSDLTLPRPLINWSQEKCGIPLDLIPPCAPVLAIVSDCDASFNSLSWNNPNLSCADDIVGYNIYYTPVQGVDPTLLITINGAINTTLLHDSLFSIAGCYWVTALDSFNNESVTSNMVCADNCPLYELPNVFTPNGDGINDYFVPFPYKYVKDVDIQIYNRWGEVVFTSTDPDINWDGTHMKSKQPCSDGVYYYVCIANEIRLTGIQPRTLTGFVQILRQKN
ncbi:MAG: gliding motility-associated C-terminal domain-containing protein [Bacteroidota bacterium]